LVAIANGEDPAEIFSSEWNVHHKNDIPWDNRPDNLEVMKHGEHRSLHEGTLDAPWKNERVLRYLYHNEGLSLREMGERFGVGYMAVSRWMDKFGIERRNAWDWNVSD